MPHFEVHTLAQNRWLIDGIFFDKQTAIDDAKLLLARTHAFDAVRVLQVEEAESGFFEWAVYIGTRPQEHHRGEPEAAAAPPVPRPAAPLRAPRSSLPRTSVLALVTVLALCGLMIHFAQRLRHPGWVWVFDRPEASLPHELHNPLTGEAER